MKWYKHDPSAALAGMIGLTVEERGAYYTLIDLQYARAPNGHGDVTDDLVIKALGIRRPRWDRLKAGLIAKGKVHETDGKLTANRVQYEVNLAILRGQSEHNIEITGAHIEENQALSSVDPEPEPESRKKEKKESASRAPKKAHTLAKTPFPEGWEPTLDPTERTEFEKFKASALAHGRVYANWEQAWQNWKLNAPKFTPTRSVKERNRETMDDLNSFIDQCAADAGSRRPSDAQGHLLLPVSKSNGAQGVSERAGERACDILGRRGNGRDSESYGSKP